MLRQLAAEALEAHRGVVCHRKRDSRPAAGRATADPHHPCASLLDSLHQWLQSTLAVVSRKSEIAAAIRYALGRWRALLRYSEDGTIEIDNNAAERALRAVALGRKNYLVCGI